LFIFSGEFNEVSSSGVCDGGMSSLLSGTAVDATNKFEEQQTSRNGGLPYQNFINKDKTQHNFPTLTRQIPESMKLPLYAPNHNAQRYHHHHPSYDQMTTSMQNFQSNNHSAALFPERNMNNFPTNFYDNYNSTHFLDNNTNPNQLQQPFSDFSRFAPYNNTNNMHNNYVDTTSTYASPSIVPTENNFKPFNPAWSNLNFSSSPSDNINPHYNVPNFSVCPSSNKWHS